MKNRKYFGLLVLLVLIPFAAVKAQYIPVVFDRIHSPMTTYNQLLLDADGQLRLIGYEGVNAQYLKLTPQGAIVHSKTIADFNAMNVAPAKDGGMLVVGGRDNGTVKARFMKIDAEDNIAIDYKYTNNGYFDKVLALRKGGYVLSGYEWPKGMGKKAIAVVISATGNLVYTIDGSPLETCAGFVEAKDGSLLVAFSAEGADARVVKYGANSRVLFSTVIPEEFDIKGLQLTRGEELVLAGGNGNGGARVVKIRPEGDIVFDKIFADGESSFTHIGISAKDEILLGGSILGGNGQVHFLRNDGTVLSSYQMFGEVTAMDFTTRGDAMVASYNERIGAGRVVRVTPTSHVLYEYPVAAKYDQLVVSVDGESTFVSTSEGRVTKFNEDGSNPFDRPIDKSENPGYVVSDVAENGDIVLAGQGGRITKLGHGLTINDIAVQEPLNGFSMANFTVTLTGFQRQQGIPLPVSVHYKVVGGKATKDDIILSSGLLSFVPVDDGNGGFMITQTIEVPIKADNLLEGNEDFYVRLEDAENGYIVKGEGRGTITDQPAIVRFISSDPGREPATDITYTVGLFKTDGTPVTNVSGSDVIITGIYGQGTASEEDFASDVKPVFVVAQGSSQAVCKVGVVDDDKYEIPESVIIQLNQTSAMSDVTVELEGGVVNCVGYIYDQPAYLAISSLGDKGKNSNTVQGFFRATLLRASDDKPLINCTGSNILIASDVDPSSTGVKGEDFVMVNETELTLPGDCQKTTVNINGVVLNNTAKVGSSSVVIQLTDVVVPENAGQLTIHPTKGKASFNIIDTRR
ncbi:MAG: hypothetical protein LBG19_07825 [Prevotellaceae bacterium]|jgi:hypothetical protein|nr:hypothetical protein [Prevotellaceae bacterium]